MTYVLQIQPKVYWEPKKIPYITVTLLNHENAYPQDSRD